MIGVFSLNIDIRTLIKFWTQICVSRCDTWIIVRTYWSDMLRSIQPFRWLRNMSTLQVITRHVYPSGDYATCLSTLQVVAWQLIGETKINYNLSLEVLDQNIQTPFYLPFVSCSPLPPPIYLVGNAFLYVYLFCLSVFLSVSYKRHKGWTEKCTNVSVSTTIHNKKKEEGGWG